ncbi:MAG: Aspartyl/glutamyl-tRNA(Asn/Gln) amidotransferase subunit B, partial [candidate division WS6 bacterium GW2011_GWE1_34_7]
KDMDTIKAAKAASNWITGAVFSIANDKKIDINEDNIPKESLSYLILEFEKKILTRNKAEELLRESLEQKKDLKELISKAIEESKENTGNLDSIADEVIKDNPKAVSDFKSGKQATIGYLVGQVMQKTKGSADPNKAKLVLIEKLNG